MKTLINQMLGAILPIAFLVQSCAVPCPPDKKGATIEFSSATLGWLPAQTGFETQTFTSNKGKTLTFKTDERKFLKRGKIDVEILCSRGDFLDKTVRSLYIDSPEHLLYYVGSDPTYTLQYRANVINAGGVSGMKDTLLFENFEVWIQKSGDKIGTGYLNSVPSFRGNEKSPEVQNATKPLIDAAFLKSVILNGKEFKEVYVNSVTDGLDIYYKKGLGLVAFKEGDETWLRK